MLNRGRLYQITSNVKTNHYTFSSKHYLLNIIWGSWNTTRITKYSKSAMQSCRMMPYVQDVCNLLFLIAHIANELVSIPRGHITTQITTRTMYSSLVGSINLKTINWSIYFYVTLKIANILLCKSTHIWQHILSYTYLLIYISLRVQLKCNLVFISCKYGKHY